MKRYIGVTAGVIACVLAAGCGSVPAAGPKGSPAPAPTAAGNRALAEQEAARLLSLVTMPDGAEPLGSAPRSLPGPLLRPAVSSRVDSARSWRVPMPLAQITAWLQTHSPRGLREDGSSSGWGPHGIDVIGRDYAGPNGPAWQSADLEVALAAAGSAASVVRADGVVVWLDPVPVRDTVPGPRMRVTVTGTCPASDAGIVGVTKPLAGLAGRLLPDGDPTAGLECRYAGFNGRRWALRSMTRLTAARAARVAAPLARLPLSHVDGAVVSCPADDRSVEVVALSYAGRPDVDLWIQLNGCGGVSNGYVLAG
jgi:hypothetical protein